MASSTDTLIDGFGRIRACEKRVVGRVTGVSSELRPVDVLADALQHAGQTAFVAGMLERRRHG
ncbi:MAG: hypothetical protein ABIO33_05755 [Leifsonia sp.]